jgi:translation elongation factor EF-1alpha
MDMAKQKPHQSTAQYRHTQPQYIIITGLTGFKKKENEKEMKWVQKASFIQTLIHTLPPHRLIVKKCKYGMIVRQ